MELRPGCRLLELSGTALENLREMEMLRLLVYKMRLLAWKDTDMSAPQEPEGKHGTGDGIRTAVTLVHHAAFLLETEVEKFYTPFRALDARGSTIHPRHVRGMFLARILALLLLLLTRADLLV